VLRTSFRRALASTFERVSPSRRHWLLENPLGRSAGSVSPSRRYWLLPIACLSALVGQACHPTGLDPNGVAVDPLADGANVHVLAFVTTQCPISNQTLPLLQSLAREFAPRGVRMWLIFPSRLDTAERIRAHRAEFAYDLPALRDPEHRLTARAKVRVTPSVGVFAADGSLAYSGRVDDRYVAFGVARPQARAHDLEKSLRDLLDGRRLRPSITAAVGCTIAD
jgi:hypothetical protein